MSVANDIEGDFSHRANACFSAPVSFRHQDFVAVLIVTKGMLRDAFADTMITDGPHGG